MRSEHETLEMEETEDSDEPSHGYIGLSWCGLAIGMCALFTGILGFFYLPPCAEEDNRCDTPSSQRDALAIGLLGGGFALVSSIILCWKRQQVTACCKSQYHRLFGERRETESIQGASYSQLLET